MSYTIQSDLSPRPGSKTFYSLRNRVLKLLFTALETETNATNIQILLHGTVYSSTQYACIYSTLLIEPGKYTCILKCRCTSISYFDLFGVWWYQLEIAGVRDAL